MMNNFSTNGANGFQNLQNIPTSLQNIMMSKINPQVRTQIENLHKMAMQGGNPEHYFLQRFGNDPKFQQAVNIVRGKSPQELNNYLGNLYNSLNNSPSMN